MKWIIVNLPTTFVCTSMALMSVPAVVVLDLIFDLVPGDQAWNAYFIAGSLGTVICLVIGLAFDAAKLLLSCREGAGMPLPRNLAEDDDT